MVFELAVAQRRAGADVEIWTPDAIRAGSTEEHAGLAIRYFMPDPEFGFVKSYRLERELVRLPSGCVLHAHNSFHPLNLQAGRAARRQGRRIFYSPHGALDPLLLRGWSWKPFKKRVYLALFKRSNLNRAAGLFALTRREAEGFREIGLTAPVHVLPNGITPVASGSAEAGADFRRRHEIPATSPVVLFIGRITPKKRVEDIIAALKRLPKTSRLVIAGDPAHEPVYHRELLARAQALGVASRVHWVGFLNEVDKRSAYAASDVFVHASISEGMALAVLEAMSAGLPCVATEGCYMSDAAEAGALIQCAQGPEALASALAPLVADPALSRRQGDAGRAYVSRAHDWAGIARRTLEIYGGAS